MKEQFSSPDDYFDKVADTTGITSIDLSLVMKLFDLSPQQVKKALDDWTKKRRKSMESISKRVHKLQEGLLLSSEEKAELVKKSLKFIKAYCKENGEEPTVNQVRSFLDNEESQLTADQAIDLANAASMAYRTQMSSALHERVNKLSEAIHDARDLDRNDFIDYVLKQHKAGDSAEEIARKLSTKVDTVKHVIKMYSKESLHEASGRTCDECGKYLTDADFDKPGSWNYTCPKCGYRYIHGQRESVHKERTNDNPPPYSVGGWNLFDTSPLEISAAKKLALELKRDGKYSDAKIDGQFKDAEDGRTYAYIRTKPSKMGEEMKSRVNSLFESVAPLGKVSAMLRSWKAKGVKKDAAIQHALDEFGAEFKDDIQEIADGMYIEAAIYDKKLQPQSGEQEGVCDVHDKIEALYADCMLAPEQAAGKMVPQDRAPMNDTFGSNREAAVSKLSPKLQKLVRQFQKHDLMDDRREYGEQDFLDAGYGLTPQEAKQLAAWFADWSGEESFHKEHHFEKGEFPFDEFKLGWETEHKEHPEFHPVDVARLVLDHMKENEHYYTKPSQSEKVTPAAEQGLGDLLAMNPAVTPEQATSQLASQGIPKGDAADTVLRYSKIAQGGNAQ